MPNPFVHVELATNNPDAAKAFYGKLFRWTFADIDVPAGPYTIVDVGDGTGGGIMKQMIPGAASAWMPYVLVDDIAAATALAKALGATVMKDVDDVTDMGQLSILEDPTGAAFGLWQPKA